jgi:hypothetical protein
VVLELTQQLMEHTPALLDLSVPLGCACAGAGEHALHGKPRAALLLHEPPRARQKVLDPSLRVDVTQTLSEACALHAVAPEEPVEVEAQVAADAMPVCEDAETPHAPTSDDASPKATIVQRRSVIFRSAASAPRSATGSGAMVPRASLAVLRRALARTTKRTAQRQPKTARARVDRSVELREGLSRPASRTPRWLAIGAADLPRPVPPPPARHRPRAMLEL